ncbi:MAG: YlbF family regulator [Clostridia bacterium]|nr:YlbF family regulator [Clostridia bacterium]
MDIVELARQLGAAMQQDEVYVNMRTAEQASEEDKDLCELMEEYNTTRLAINYEASKADRDDSKMQELNKKMRSAYAKIMQNEHMKEYNAAKVKFETKLQAVLGIIQSSAMGEDPYTVNPETGCTGSCATCGSMCN